MKQRLISAAVAAIIAIPLIIIGGTPYNIGVGILGIIGFNELLTIRSNYKKIPILVKIVSIICFSLILVNRIDAFEINEIYLPIILIINMLFVLFYKRNVFSIEDALFIVGSILFLGCSFNYLLVLRNINLMYFIYLLLITITTDTFAHFYGTKIGKYKLCPNISPNKTIEGLVGGTIFGTYVGIMFFTTFVESTISIPLVIIMSLVLALFTSAGDLIFSNIKRHYEVKDFGKIMPGHGGILDRLDSLLICTFVFRLFIELL